MSCRVWTRRSGELRHEHPARYVREVQERCKENGEAGNTRQERCGGTAEGEVMNEDIIDINEAYQEEVLAAEKVLAAVHTLRLKHFG